MFSRKRLTLPACIALTAALSACGGAAPQEASSSAPSATTGSSTPATPAASPSPTAQPSSEAPAPQPKGPWKQGDDIPKLDKSVAEFAPPKNIGAREGGPSSSGGIWSYQAPGGPISMIQTEKVTMDFILKSQGNATAYDRFICTGGASWGGGIKCYVGLKDGVVSFQHSAGPKNTMEQSAAFAAEALDAMGS